MSRLLAETMPSVTVPPRPNGLPIASTQSPTRVLSLSGELHRLQRLGSARPSARRGRPSCRGPRSLAGSLVPSLKFTWMSSGARR